MLKNQQVFNISLEGHATDIMVFPVPSLESVKQLNTSIYLDEKTKNDLHRQAQKETARPYVIAAVGSEVTVFKAGDFIFANPDSMGVATVIRFSATEFWKNPIIIPSFYAYKVAEQEEYEKEYDAIIDWFNNEQVKKEAILAQAKGVFGSSLSPKDFVVGFKYKILIKGEWEERTVSEEDVDDLLFLTHIERNIESQRIAV